MNTRMVVPLLNLFVDLSHYEVMPLHREYIASKIVDAIVEKDVD